MQKAVIITLSLLILAVLGFICFSLISTKQLPAIYAVQTDGTKIDTYPFVSWDDITTGKLENFWQNRVSLGLLKWNGSELPVNTLKLTNDEAFDLTEFRYVSLSFYDLNNRTFVDPSKRPWKIVAFYKTKIDSTSYLVIWEAWKNSDGTTGFIPLILPEANTKNPDGLATYLSGIATHTIDFLAPITEFAGHDTCIATMAGESSYCDWFFGQAGGPKSYQSLAIEWVGTGKIPKNAAQMPMIFIKRGVQ